MKYLYSFIFLLCFYQSNAQGWRWARRNTDTPGVNIETMHCVTDTAGNVFFEGYTVTFTTGSSYAGNRLHFGPFTIVDSDDVSQGLVGKLDPAGNYQWVVSTQHANVAMYSIVTDPAGNLYVTGAYDSARCRIGNVVLTKTNTIHTTFLAKIAPSGNVLWAKNVGSNNNYVGVAIDGAGYIYVTSSLSALHDTVGTVVLSNPNSILITKFDASGNVIWAIPESGGGFAFLNNCVVSPNGNTYICGICQSSSLNFYGGYTVTRTGLEFFFVAKYDSSGNFLWVRPIQLTKYDVIGDILLDKAENLYFTGGFMEDTLRFGSYLLTNHNADTTDVFLVKYDHLGNVIWAKSAGGPRDDAGFCLAIDECNNLWLTGNMCGNNAFFTSVPTYHMDFGGHSLAVPPLTGVEMDPLFLAELDTAGNYFRGWTIPSGGDDPCGIAVDNKGNFFIAGDWVNPTWPFLGDILGRDYGEEYFFAAKFAYDSSGCLPYVLPLKNENTLPVSEDYLLYPNPASDIFTVVCPERYAHSSRLELFDMMGKLIGIYPLQNTTEIRTDGIAPGMYIARLLNESNLVSVKKLIVIK